MTKISDFIKILTGYANQVHLVEEFTDPTKNRDRMVNYRPIKSHRETFRKIALAQKPTEEKCILMTGIYGSGKSHLSLMLANYFSRTKSAPELEALFSNWSERDPDGATFVRDLRGDGHYLVAIGEYGQGKDFEEMILDAVQAALAREGNAGIALDSHYKEAVRQIERWEKRQQEGSYSGTLRDFLAEMEASYPGQTLDSLKRDLAANQGAAMSDFKDIYRKVIGRDFDYNQDNLIDILSDLMSSPEFIKCYKGLVIIADEFGYFLEYARLSIDNFQRFAEMCRDGVNGRQLIFIGTGHKRFSVYGSGRLAQADFRVVSDRVKEIQLETEEIEQIIGAIIKPDTSHPAWKSIVEGCDYWLMNLAKRAKEAQLFPHLKEPSIRSEIVENIYPVHPMALHCLIELSRDLGSNARSIYTFFTGGSELQPLDGSYPIFIRENEPIKNNRPNLYTADILIRYFDSALRPESTELREAVRGHIRNYQASREEALRLVRGQLQSDLDPLEDRLLRLMLIFKICNVPTNEDLLVYGLDCSTGGERNQLDNLLAALVKQKVIYLPPNGNEYEFRRSDSEDFESMIAAFKGDASNHPADMAKTVSELVKTDPLVDAKGYNNDFAEDKRVLRVFARPGDLVAKYPADGGQQVDFWTHQETKMGQPREWKDRYEGIAVYVLCETATDVDDARAAIATNISQRIIVGIPSQPIPIDEAVMDVLAARSIEKSENFTKYSLPDQLRLQDDILGDETRETGFLGTFIRLRRRYLEAKELAWAGKSGKTILPTPKNEYEPADELIRSMFAKRNRFANQTLNQIHLKGAVSKDAVFGDAIRALVEIEKPVLIDRSQGPNINGRKYLDLILAENNVLRLIGGQYTQTIGTYQIETDLAKYQEKLPALAELVTRLRDIPSGKQLSVTKVLTDLAAVPFGQGPIALALFLACAARYFGDELRLKLDPAKYGYASIADSSIIFGLVTGQYAAAQFERVPITTPKRELLNGLFDCFSTEAQPAQPVQRAVIEAWTVMKAWWDGRTDLEKCESLHADGDDASQLILFFKKNSQATNLHQVVLSDFPESMGIDPSTEPSSAQVESLLTRIREAKGNVETAAQTLKDNLLEDLMHEFAPQATQYTEYLKALSDWYAGLDSEQKDPFAAWQTPASKALLRLVPKIESLPKSFLEILPAETGYIQRKVDEWVTDRSADYKDKLAKAKALIEKHALRVALPIWEVIGSQYRIESRGGGTQVYFRGSVSLKVSVPGAGVTVFVVQGNEDPRTAKQRGEVKISETIVIDKDCTIRMVCQDAASQDFGKVLDIAFVDDDRKYAPVMIKPTIDPLEREYNFIYPADRQALQVFLKGWVNLIVVDDLITVDDIRVELEKLLKDGLMGTQENG